MNYKEAGVDTEKAQKLIFNLKEKITSTHKNLPTGQVVGNYGSFAGIFQPQARFNGQEIVATTDGVGTKIKLAQKFDHLEGLGYDLVAMCVNDLYCVGASPLFFLDYIACGRLDESWYNVVLGSISDACLSVPMALLGGETAEHPGVMPADDFDLAGFCVGMVAPDKKIPRPETMQEGDVLTALPSSGPHSNGFSLIRRLLETFEKEQNAAALEKTANADWVKQNLLAPTRIYTYLPELLKNVEIKGIAHITGGGLYENLPRVLPSHLQAFIGKDWPFHLPAFDLFSGYVSRRELFKAFNMGAGMVLVSSAAEAEKIRRYEPAARQIGELRSGLAQPLVIEGLD